MLGLRPQENAPLRSVRTLRSLQSLVRIGPGGILPIVFLAALFAAFASYMRLPIGMAATLGGVGGTASLLVHELGHVCAARGLAGIRSAGISLVWGGAATRFEGTYASGSEQSRVAIAGPRASFAFAGGLLLACPFPSSQVRDMLVALVLFNILIGVVNLLPAYPLDGHKVVFGLLWSATGSEGTARRIIRRIGAGWALLELPSAVGLLFVKPAAGVLAVIMIGSLVVQKRLVRKPVS